MAPLVSRVVIAIYCTSMLQFACIQNMAVSEHANETGHVPVWDHVRYCIYSLIRRTIFYEKICLFYQNLLKTWGASFITDQYRKREMQYRSTIGRLSVGNRPTIGRQSTDSRPTVDR